MTAYSHTLSLRLPASLLPIAQAISRALDPDSGGADSWMVDGDTIFTAGPCTEDFYLQAQAMLADPQLLFAAVAWDYSQRWQDLDPPTLAECEAFVNGIIQPTGETNALP